MTLVLGCIADDYTGASDLANTLTRCGLRTVQTIGVPDDTLALPDVDAVVVSLKSRSIAASLAVEQSLAADSWLRRHGAAHVLFKICSTFDSTDAGNIGPVMDALRKKSGDAVIMVTPAFPGTGRTVFQGNLFVGTVPLNESPLKDHPLNPMRDSNLVRVLAKQSNAKIGLIDLAVVAAGPEAIARKLTEFAAQEVGVAIADAVFDRDLETIGRVALGHRMSVGASGMGLGLAQAIMAPRGLIQDGSFSTETKPIGGPVACLAGSCSQATLEQIVEAEKSMPVLRLDPEQVVAGASEIERAMGWARKHLPERPVLIVSSSNPEQVAALQARHGREAAGHAIEQAMAAISERMVDAGVRRLVIAGGETSGAVIDRLGIPAFMVGPEIAAGVPVLQAVDWKRGNAIVALKSGNFGGPDFFNDAIRLMP